MLENLDTTQFVEDSLSDLGCGVRTPENIKQIIQEIAARHNVSFSMAKYRLIELGFTKAEGIGVYLDNAYIPDHGTANGWPEKRH